MERALAEYLAVFARCLAGCEGAHEQVDFKDFYPAIAGTFHPDPSGHPSHPQGPELLRPLDTNIHSTRISRGLLSALGFFPSDSDGKESACKVGDLGSIPGLGRSPGGETGNPPQYCQENSMDRGAWRVSVHGVTKSQTQLSD